MLGAYIHLKATEGGEMIERLKVKKGDFVTGVTLLALIMKVNEIIDCINQIQEEIVKDNPQP